MRRTIASNAASTSPARLLAGNILPVGSTFVLTPSASIRSTKRWGLSAARAEWRNGPCSANAATIPRASAACVRLQREPPDMRIWPRNVVSSPTGACGGRAGPHRLAAINPAAQAHDYNHIPHSSMLVSKTLRIASKCVSESSTRLSQYSPHVAGRRPLWSSRKACYSIKIMQIRMLRHALGT